MQQSQPQFSSLPVKYWRRFKYKFKAALAIMDRDTIQSLGFPASDIGTSIWDRSHFLELWTLSLTAMLTKPEHQSLRDDYALWQLKSVEHWKDMEKSPWHEFIVLEWHHPVSQAEIWSRLERDSGQKRSDRGTMRGPDILHLSLHASSTSVSQISERMSDASNSEADGPLEADDSIRFSRRKAGVLGARSKEQKLLASFKPSLTSGGVGLTPVDVMLACQGVREASNRLYCIRYMC